MEKSFTPSDSIRKHFTFLTEDDLKTLEAAGIQTMDDIQTADQKQLNCLTGRKKLQFVRRARELNVKLGKSQTSGPPPTTGKRPRGKRPVLLSDPTTTKKKTKSPKKKSIPSSPAETTVQHEITAQLTSVAKSTGEKQLVDKLKRANIQTMRQLAYAFDEGTLQSGPAQISMTGMKKIAKWLLDSKAKALIGKQQQLATWAEVSYQQPSE